MTNTNKFRRYAKSVRQFIRFGLVGGSGVLVNMLVFVLAKKLGAHEDGPVLAIPFTDFNLRMYHVYSTLAFVVANLWNFQLNRWWTFGSHRSGSKWLREYGPFVVVGLAGYFVSVVMLTALMWAGSPIRLPREVFDGSTGLRTAAYWAQLISVLVAVPITFWVNKFWTFRAIRSPAEEATIPTDVH